MEVEKAKHSLETYEKGMDRGDRQFEHFAQAVQAAKPEVPHTLVGGEAAGRTYVGVGTGSTEAPPPQTAKKGRFCSECGADLGPTSKFCSECGTKVE